MGSASLPAGMGLPRLPPSVTAALRPPAFWAREGPGLKVNGLGCPLRLLSPEISRVTPVFLTYGGAGETVKERCCGLALSADTVTPKRLLGMTVPFLAQPRLRRRGTSIPGSRGQGPRAPLRSSDHTGNRGHPEPHPGHLIVLNRGQMLCASRASVAHLAPFWFPLFVGAPPSLFSPP